MGNTHETENRKDVDREQQDKKVVDGFTHRTQTIINHQTKTQITHMQRQYILVVDVGSSSIRASPYEIDTEKNSLHAHPHAKCVIKIRSPRISEFGTADPVAFEKATRTAISECIKTMHVHNKNGFKIIALGFDCFVMNWLGVNEKEYRSHRCTRTRTRIRVRRGCESNTKRVGDSNDLESSYQRVRV